MAETLTIGVVNAPAIAFLREVERLTAEWPQSKRDAFSAHWAALEMHGCEMCETTRVGETLFVSVSEDLRRAFVDFGVKAN